jgi:hydroxymethylglutaryl-CoA lyase
MMLPRIIRITEVGPRDGLQNEKAALSTEQKVEFINLLSRAGADEIEVSSFVSPKWVPQLGDAVEVFRAIDRRENVMYSALVPNITGMERALELGPGVRPDKVALFTAASETFTRKNVNASIDETLERFRPVIELARQENLPVRVYISCVVMCPYEGRIEPTAVAGVIRKLLDLGLDPSGFDSQSPQPTAHGSSDDIDLGETIGIATPSDIERLYDELDGIIEPEDTTLHLHDTRGTALACAYAAMMLGVYRFDASCAGLGGCPYAPGAAGNLATEDLVYLCQHMDSASRIDLQRQFEAGRYIQNALNRPLPGKVFSVDGVTLSDCNPNIAHPPKGHKKSSNS